MFFDGLADDLGRADAFRPGHGFELLFEPALDPDVDAFNYMPLFVILSDTLPRLSHNGKPSRGFRR
jgi:hypothetical protein